MNNIQTWGRDCRSQPAFAGQLAKKQSQSYKPENDIFLYFGENSWGYGKAMQHINDVLVLPPQSEPDNYNWHVVKNLPILAIDTTPSGSGFDLIENLSYELLKSGASIVRVILACNKLAIYRRVGVS